MMDCPKCNGQMLEHEVRTLEAKVVIDRCEQCSGIWFDHGEAELLKDDWMTEFLDSGDPMVGKSHNAQTNVKCPRCNTEMETKSDPKQSHIHYEVCEEHGIYMDAGEFTDYKYETVMDIFRDLISATLKKSK